MEDKKEPSQPLFDQLGAYIETRIKLAKYKAIDDGSAIFAGIIADAVVIISMVLAFIFASFTLAFYLAGKLESDWEGFGCVALLYFIIAIIIKINKRNLEKPIANTFVRKIFKH